MTQFFKAILLHDLPDDIGDPSHYEMPSHTPYSFRASEQCESLYVESDWNIY